MLVTCSPFSEGIPVEADTRTVVQPESTELGLLLRNLQPLPPPYPLDPFDAYDSTSLMPHRGDAAVAISAILEGGAESWPTF